jgi:SulP family sulfate permease
LFCLLAFVARLGFVAQLLSQPVLLGYLAGVAVIMIIGQLGRLTGIRVAGSSPAAQLMSVGRCLPQVNAGTLLLGLATLTFPFLLPRALPGPRPPCWLC